MFQKIKRVEQSAQNDFISGQKCGRIHWLIKGFVMPSLVKYEAHCHSIPVKVVSLLPISFFGCKKKHLITHHLTQSVLRIDSFKYTLLKSKGLSVSALF